MEAKRIIALVTICAIGLILGIFDGCQKEAPEETREGTGTMQERQQPTQRDTMEVPPAGRDTMP
jgi:hypothetical protein